MQSRHDKHYQLVKQAIEYIDSNRARQPNLTQLAEHLQLSPSHMQRLFSEWVGVSPNQWLHYLTKEYAKQQLDSCSVYDCAIASGLSSASRLYDLFIRWEAMTPGEYKSGGLHLQITYGFADSPFGTAMLANTSRGICRLEFVDVIDETKTCFELKTEWPKADLTRNDKLIHSLCDQIFFPKNKQKQPLKLFLKGSKFQHLVWQALLKIPYGNLCSYQSVAQYINKPSSTRAVASAIARNNIAYLIPCHRVIRSTGEFNQYRWGSVRKRALVTWEAARSREKVASFKP